MMTPIPRRFRTFRKTPCWGAKLALLALVAAHGCGGQVSDSFTHSVYIEITDSGSLQPTTMLMQNGYRIVFVNNDVSEHTINWNSPLVLSAVAPAGQRAWFELPSFLPGTVISYHLDTSGPGGTITIVSPP